MPESPAPAVVRAPDFPPGLDWLFTAPAGAPNDAHGAGPALTLADLRGKVAVLDLWTYGCVNCQHVVPTLAALEARFPREVVVVGVHSGKFIAERETARVAHAARRLGAAGHPTVNDRQFRLWRAWAARGWPTVAVVDPRGYVVWQQAGEPRLDALAGVVGRVVAEADAAGALDRAPRAWQGGAHAPHAPGPGGALRYPGGLAVSAPDARGVRRLAVASNGDGGPGARVLVGRLDARGRRLVVEREVAPADDPFARVQGLAFAPHAQGEGPATLYVADTGTHRVRAVDLATGAVRTVAGTGVRVRTAADRAAGAIASPWALLPLGGVGPNGAPGGAPGGALLVAMAGTHELWRVGAPLGAPGDPRPAADLLAGPVAGGRGEGLVDAPPGAPARDALLAQPLALATDGHRVWWADAEASAVRETTRAALEGRGDDGTRTLVGTGLFDFGDRDGVGDEARLQHPQGLAWVADAARLGGPSGGRLLVADGYNDALKWVDPETRVVETWARGFAEPGAVVVAGEVAYVADTNAHRVVGMEAGERWEVEIG